MKTPTHHDLDILARTIFGEARGETRLGMAAVAHVIRNRAHDRRWPNTLAGVCLQPWQFSCWNENDPNLFKIERVGIENAFFRTCWGVGECVAWELIPDPTSGATHYHHRRIKPEWAKGREPCYSLGSHAFYNDVP